ncbi:MAG: hypothetical protein KKC43_03500 [Alphaproteobacteria bacterium]|nr:hypothetical protein [Alphaproteobacteria bacterium]
MSDKLAGELLASKGIAWHSVQAEAFWKDQYISAWLEHPTHVLQAILFRFQLILTKLDLDNTVGLPSNDVTNYLLWVLICAAPIALFWLLWKRRWTDAFLIALPAGYAVCSLGFLYVEFRYVRYATLTYILAFPVFVTAVSDLPSHFFKGWGPSQARALKSTLGVFVAMALVAYSTHLLPTLRLLALDAAATERRDLRSFDALAWTGDLRDISFSKAVPDVDFSISELGLQLSLQTKANDGSYMLVAPMNIKRNKMVLIEYELVLKEGGAGIGFLSGNDQYWMSYKRLTGEPNSTLKGRMYQDVQVGSKLVITAEDGGENGHRVIFKNLRWKAACPEYSGLEPLMLLGNNDLIPMGPCP